MAATICCTHAMAQDNIETLLQEIEKNNTTLKALRYDTEAQKSANRSENALPDPELEVGYLWGRPSAIGSRKDFSAKQSFDIPAITGQRTRQSKQKDRLADSQYNLQRTALLLQAKLLCIDLIYYNARIATLNERIKASRIVAEGQAKQLSCGDISPNHWIGEILLKLPPVEIEEFASLQSFEHEVYIMLSCHFL